VNLGWTIQGWRFDRYTESLPAVRNILQTGVPVQIFHTDAQAFLSASTALYKRDPALVRYQGDTQTVKTMWMVEKQEQTQGVDIIFGDGVRLKHLPSGRYLAVPQRVHQNDSMLDIHLLSPEEVDRESFDGKTLFLLRPVTSELKKDDAEGTGVGLATPSTTVTLRMQHKSTRASFWLHNTKKAQDKSSYWRSSLIFLLVFQ